MSTPAETWERYTLESHAPRLLPCSAPRPPAQDLVDFAFALAALRREAGVIERLMIDADECEARRGPTLRAHLSDLRLLASHAAALVAEAELEAA